MPATEFHPGDACYCRVYIHPAVDNPFTILPLFVVLEIQDTYFFAPSFSAGVMDYYTVDFSGNTDVHHVVLPEFTWPDYSGEPIHARWFAAVTDTDVKYIIAGIDTFDFSWE